MSLKPRKQFGVWMDTHHATVIGREQDSPAAFSVVGRAEGPRAPGNGSEKSAHNQERAMLHHFFKEITSHLVNAEEVHVTGTGTAQEQFIHYLAETPQFKDTTATESTSNKMSDEQLVEFIHGKFH